ncbi:hypothetical protein HY440_00890 [Candidatus Microgenomates bacterium]|nr:hypothetical protein [Candidatus Microgenomates bacterium]
MNPVYTRPIWATLAGIRSLCGGGPLPPPSPTTERLKGPRPQAGDKRGDPEAPSGETPLVVPANGDHNGNVSLCAVAGARQNQ